MKLKKLAVTILMITILLLLSNRAQATTGKINAETVNIRKDPSTDATILDQLDKNDEVEILEEEDGWYKVNATIDEKNLTGYISKSLVDIKDDTTITEEPENETTQNNASTENNETDGANTLVETTSTEATDNNQTQSEQGSIDNEITTTENTEKIAENQEYTLLQEINLRILPLIYSKERVNIASGNVTVTEIINDWCKIENDTQTGWIRKIQLEKAIEPQDNSTSSETQNSNTPDEQENGQEDEQTPEENGTDGTTNSSSNTSSSTSEQAPEVTQLNKTGYVSASGLRVRKEPTTSSEELDILTLNDKVTIIGEVDGWYQIEYNDEVGYVSAKYVSDTRVSDTTSRGGVDRTSQTKQENTSSTVSNESQNTISNEAQNTASEETDSNSTTGTTGEAIVAYAKQYLGYKYVSGGSSPSKGFDCSGFTTYVFSHFGISLSRTSSGQSKNGVAVERSNLSLGDIVIFKNSSKNAIGHVGIYIGDGNFIHSGNSKTGVIITALSSSYYKTRYVGARRVI